MPQMSVAPSLWLNGTTELILDTSKNKSKKKNKMPMPPRYVKCKGLLREIHAKLPSRDHSPLFVNCFRTSHFSL